MAIISDIKLKVLAQIAAIAPELLEPAENRRGILLAVSGGTDSMALLEIFVQLAAENNWRLLAGHLNHCLRGPESNRDEQYVREQCQRVGIVCQSRKVDVAAAAADAGVSIETAARDVRYGFFRELCEQYELKYIATGHHADDNIETVLHRLLRGTGIRGLAGIKTRRRLDNDRGRELTIFRPLLEISRGELESYIAAAHIRICHDSSNDSLDYTRNRIRNRLIPELRADYNPAVARALANLSRLATDADDILREQAEMDLQAAGSAVTRDGLGIIPLETLLQLSAGRSRNLLHHVLEQIGVPLSDIGYQKIEDIRRECHKAGSRLLMQLPGGFQTELAAGKLIISRAKKPNKTAEQIQLPLPGVAAVADLVDLADQQAITAIKAVLVELADFDLEQFRRNKPANQELLDRDKVAGELFIAPLPAGCRYQPLGMSGSQTSGDIMTNFKLPRYLRGQLAAICDADGIVCIPGHRIADRLKVDSDSKHGILLSFSKG